MNAGEEVLVFYNEKSSFSQFIEMMKTDRNRMEYDDGSPLRYIYFYLLQS